VIVFDVVGQARVGDDEPPERIASPGSADRSTVLRTSR
jgi:hypothetical protein